MSFGSLTEILVESFVMPTLSFRLLGDMRENSVDLSSAKVYDPNRAPVGFSKPTKLLLPEKRPEML